MYNPSNISNSIQDPGTKSGKIFVSIKIQKTTNLLNDRSTYLIIKRFSGSSKKAVEVTGKVLAENFSHSPKPPISRNIVKNTETPSVLANTNTTSNSRPSSPEKVQTKESNSPSLNITKQAITSVTGQVPSGLAPGKYTPFNKIVNNVASQNTSPGENMFVEHDTTSFIPIPPPLPAKPIEHHTIPSKPINLEEDLQKVFVERTQNHKNIMSQLNELEKRGLYDHETGKAKSSFYQYTGKTSSDMQKVSVDLSEKDFLNNPAMNLGLLRVTHIEKTEILSGNQTHPILLYTVKDDKIIVWGYLTSEKDVQCKKLSDYQPFSEKSEAQYLRIITPMIVQKSDIESLPEDQQAKGIAYIKTPVIQTVMKKEFVTTILPTLKEPLMVYDGKGITSETINKVIDNYDLTLGKKAEHIFKIYLQKKNQFDELALEKWLTRIEKYDKDIYPQLKKLIENHENK